MPWIFPLVIIFIVLVIIVRNIVVVQQSRAYVVERLGAFSRVWQVGIHLKVPFIERVAKKVSLKEQVLDYPPQPVITKDNVTMQIDTVVYFQITDPKLYAYGVEHPMMAMETLTATTLRNIIGDLELDQTLTSRDVINTRMRAILDEATDPWGIKVNRVELKNILPPQDIQNSMEKQMKAERDRRQAILQAEGAKHSQILVAEGEKEAAILKADAEKQAAILRAEAEKESAILKADGEAQAIRAVQQALADSLEMLNEKAPNDQVLRLKALEAMQKIADGQATKIIIPSELQGLAGLAAGIVESAKLLFGKDAAAVFLDIEAQLAGARLPVAEHGAEVLVIKLRAGLFGGAVGDVAQQLVVLVGADEQRRRERVEPAVLCRLRRRVQAHLIALDAPAVNVLRHGADERAQGVLVLHHERQVDRFGILLQTVSPRAVFGERVDVRIVPVAGQVDARGAQRVDGHIRARRAADVHEQLHSVPFFRVYSTIPNAVCTDCKKCRANFGHFGHRQARQAVL